MLLRYLLFSLTLLLSGCSTLWPTAPTETLSWSEQRNQLAKLKKWELSGKLAIVTAKQKGSARLNWLQEGEDYHLTLTTIIGTHLLEVEQKQGKVRLVDGNGIEHQSEDAQALIYQLTGWQLPLKELPLWVLGLTGSAPGQFNADGSLAQLKSDGWTIDYQVYQQVEQYQLPELMILKGSGNRLKLQINDWELNP